MTKGLSSLTLQQITYFLEIAETRHFTKASQNLYVSQSSLSHAIQQLEKELEVPLFIRKSGKKVVLTQYAQKLLPYCERIVKEMTDADQAISRMRNPLSGVVTVFYSYSNCASLVPEVFRQFYIDNKFEDIQVEFQINHTQVKMEDEMLEGKTDLVFSCTTDKEGLAQEAIAKQQLYVLLPSNHPLAGRDKLTIPELKDESIVCYYHGWNLSNRVEALFRSHDLRPNYSQFVDSWTAQMAMVSLGLGVAICPKMPVDQELLTYVLLDDPMSTRNVYISWAKDRKLPPSVEYVRDYCIDYFRKKNSRGGGKD